MRESEFQKQVMDLARIYQWRVAHFGNTSKIIREKSGGYSFRPDPAGKGFPDLVLVRNGRLIFAELKAEKGQLRPDQREWLADLEVVRDSSEAIEVYIWRPSNLQQIAYILR